MKVEIEIKMRLTDRPATEARLRELGAAEEPAVLESNTYFDSPGGDLKSSDRGLRVRHTVHADGSTSARITYKGPRAHGKLKSRIETELKVDDARAAAEMLTAIGYLPSLSFEKKRVTWKLDDCLVELDTLPYLGDYVEIEGESDDAVLALRDKLGLADAPMLRASYISMMATYILEHQLTERVITFEASEQSV